MVVIAMLALSICAFGDMFGPKRDSTSIRGAARSERAIVDSDTIIDTTSQILDYLGPKEGVFIDFGEGGECCNFIAGTVYTYDPWALSLAVGMINDDGAAVTVDYNVGKHIPCEDVPILSVFEYLYVGAGGGARSLENSSGDDEWQAAYGLDAQFKLTW